MGVDESRLTAKGFGETKPIDKNDSAEGKANNRRVEFVKM
jgi:flagellar motor protein MotB